MLRYSIDCIFNISTSRVKLPLQLGDTFSTIKRYPLDGTEKNPYYHSLSACAGERTTMDP